MNFGRGRTLVLQVENAKDEPVQKLIISERLAKVVMAMMLTGVYEGMVEFEDLRN